MHTFIVQEEILKKIHEVFWSTSTSKQIKELIQILLANTTFTYSVHSILIENQGIQIFEQIIKKEETI